MIIRVLDFETTGLPPDASVCEAAFVDVFFAPYNAISIVPTLPKISLIWHELIQPTTPMTLAALATHHIAGQEAISFGIPHQRADAIICGKTTEYPEACYFAAHNADFEKAFFNPDGSKWLCTYKIALRLWPESPSHSNQFLRYFLNLNLGSQAMPPHRAAPDAYVTAHILMEALKFVPLDDMFKWSEEPPYLTTLQFGKHRGQKFSDVPHGYLEWILKQDFEPGVIAAAKRELGQ